MQIMPIEPHRPIALILRYLFVHNRRIYQKNPQFFGRSSAATPPFDLKQIGLDSALQGASIGVWYVLWLNILRPELNVPH
jgi:hypothetical protein